MNDSGPSPEGGQRRPRLQVWRWFSRISLGDESLALIQQLRNNQLTYWRGGEAPHHVSIFWTPSSASGLVSHGHSSYPTPPPSPLPTLQPRWWAFLRLALCWVPSFSTSDQWGCFSTLWSHGFEHVKNKEGFICICIFWCSKLFRLGQCKPLQLALEPFTLVILGVFLLSELRHSRLTLFILRA